MNDDQAKPIKLVSKDNVLRLCGAQLIVGLHSVVKELIENSIDAGAKSLNIQIKNYGLNSISVQDDGHGVLPEDYELIAKQYTTSKISTFEDFQKFNSLGFRGEAINSLCTLADVNIVTRTAKDQMATSLDFDSNGNLVKKSPSNAGFGTCVTVSNIFKSIPVRRVNLEKHAQREFQKIVCCVESYAIFKFNIAFNVVHIEKNQALKRIIFTNGKGDMKQVMESVWTRRVCSNLVFVEEELLDFGYVQGYITNLDARFMQGTNKFQVIFINQRPVENTKIQKFINQFYKQNILATSDLKFCPVFALSFTLKSAMLDFNLTPDKKRVVLQEEKEIVNLLFEYFRRLFKLDSVNLDDNEEPAFEDRRTTEIQKPSDIIHNTFAINENARDNQAKSLARTTKIPENNKFADESSEFIKILNDLSSNHKKLSSFDNFFPDQKEVYSSSSYVTPRKRKSFVRDEQFDLKLLQQNSPVDPANSELSTDVLSKNNYFADAAPSSDLTFENCVKNSIVQNYEVVAENDEDIVRRSVDSELSIFFDINEYVQKFNGLLSAVNSRKKSEVRTRIFKTRLLDGGGNEAEAEEELSRLVNKQDFLKMKIIGQFNLGFIIAELDEHLFILDQHAADEKFNYERMHQNMEFERQKLLVPIDVEVGPADEEVILANLEIFEKNGFKFCYDETNSPFKRLKLISHPLYNEKFEISDVFEILNQLKTNSLMVLPRPKRLYNFLASRACRSSVMIGQVLSKNEMEKIVRNMSMMKNPWNCPHGRPTIRHLMSLRTVVNKKNSKN